MASSPHLNSDWMSMLCPQLWDLPLHHLSIPGSCDTMTYCLSRKSPISHSESRLLQVLGKVLPCVTLPMVLRWSVTQTLDVTEQLDAGVRYLDLRIAHMPGGLERNLHFVHKVYSTALVEDTLTDISEWLQKHPQEVIILACRYFEDMTPHLHEYLVTCIQNIFGDMLCPRGEVPTLRQLWARGQQVLVSYEHEGSVRRHRVLWPAVPYWWADQVNTEALISYLERMKSCGRPGGLFAAGVNLTGHLTYVLAHLSRSLSQATLLGLAASSVMSSRSTGSYSAAESRPGPLGDGCVCRQGDRYVGQGQSICWLMPTRLPSQHWTQLKTGARSSIRSRGGGGKEEEEEEEALPGASSPQHPLPPGVLSLCPSSSRVSRVPAPRPSLHSPLAECDPRQVSTGEV